MACNKEKKAVDDNNSFPRPEPVEVDAAGTWTLYSYMDEVNGQTTIYNAADIPCMRNNKLVVESDSTASFIYTANDTCYIYKDASTSSSIRYGQKGQNIALIWNQEKNTFRYKFATSQGKYAYGKLEQLTSSKRLTIKDTMPTGLIITIVYNQ
jgi:hypothetical protein